MKIHEYLDAKYGGKATTLLACEAKVFGIPYPTPSGWLKDYGGIEITSDVAESLKIALEKSDKQTAKDGLRVLNNAWIELKSIPSAKSKDFLESKYWKRLRYKALVLNGNKCQCCGSSPSTGAVLNVDHVLPRLLFPELALQVSNLQVLCSDCNEGKGNWDMTRFKENAIR